MSERPVYYDAVVNVCGEGTGAMALINAVQEENLKFVKKLIESNPLVTFGEVEITEAFNVAIDCGNLEIVQYLYEKGVDIHQNDDESLMRACAGEQKDEIVEWLLPKYENPFGKHNALLQYICRYEKTDLFESVLRDYKDKIEDFEYIMLSFAVINNKWYFIHHLFNVYEMDKTNIIENIVLGTLANGITLITLEKLNEESPFSDELKEAIYFLACGVKRFDIAEAYLN